MVLREPNAIISTFIYIYSQLQDNNKTMHTVIYPINFMLTIIFSKEDKKRNPKVLEEIPKKVITDWL